MEVKRKQTSFFSVKTEEGSIIQILVGYLLPWGPVLDKG